MTRLSVPDMSCGHYTAAIETALAAVPEVGDVVVDLVARQVGVTGTAATDRLVAALDTAGYPSSVVPG